MLRYSILFFIVLSMMFAGVAWSEQGSTATALQASMEATGATCHEIRLHCFCWLPGPSRSDQELKAMVYSTMEQLGANISEVEIKEMNSNSNRSFQAMGNKDGCEFLVQAGNVQSPHRVNSKQYIAITIKTCGKSPVIDPWYNKVDGIFCKIGVSPRITTCLVGWLDGKLEKDDWEVRLRSAKNSLSATDIDALAQSDFINLTCFTPVIKEWVMVRDKRTNLNMAIRFSPYDNRTYVVIGTPVIFGEF